jgi:hypothetical protein
MVDYSAGTEGSNAIITRAMQSAIAEWNTYSSLTHVVFDPATPGQQADLAFYHTVSSSLTGGCAHFSPTRTGFIMGRNLKQDYQVWVNLKSQLS